MSEDRPAERSSSQNEKPEIKSIVDVARNWGTVIGEQVNNILQVASWPIIVLALAILAVAIALIAPEVQEQVNKPFEVTGKISSDGALPHSVSFDLNGANYIGHVYDSLSGNFKIQYDKVLQPDSLLSLKIITSRYYEENKQFSINNALPLEVLVVSQATYVVKPEKAKQLFDVSELEKEVHRFTGSHTLDFELSPEGLRQSSIVDTRFSYDGGDFIVRFNGVTVLERSVPAFTGWGSRRNVQSYIEQKFREHIIQNQEEITLRIITVLQNPS